MFIFSLFLNRLLCYKCEENGDFYYSAAAVSLGIQTHRPRRIVSIIGWVSAAAEAVAEAVVEAVAVVFTGFVGALSGPKSTVTTVTAVVLLIYVCSAVIKKIRNFLIIFLVFITVQTRRRHTRAPVSVRTSVIPVATVHIPYSLLYNGKLFF